MRQRRRFYEEECGQEFCGCDDVRNLSVRHLSLPGSPPLWPKPEQSKVKAAYPRSANLNAYTSGICSLTVSQEPVMRMPGWRVSKRSVLRKSWPTSHFPYFELSGPELADIRSRVNAYSGVAGYGIVDRTLSRDKGEADRVSTMQVTSGFFDVLGVRPVRGRTHRKRSAAQWLMPRRPE
jgi:hypothetical protein